jgi:TonB family protein
VNLSIRRTLKVVFWCILSLTAICLEAQDLVPPNSAVRSDVNTRIGPLHNVILYAPLPVYPPIALQQRFTGHGVYAIDIVNGNVEDVRVVKSTGHKELDEAAIVAFRQWRFRPHSIYKTVIPVDFRLTSTQTLHKAFPTAKAIAIFAPKPEYPLEARARRWGGSGVVMLDVDVETGKVIAAHMSKSTGHQILDESALSAFGQWRFQPGKAAPHVKIPINYSVAGATY